MDNSMIWYIYFKLMGRLLKLICISSVEIGSTVVHSVWRFDSSLHHYWFPYSFLFLVYLFLLNSCLFFMLIFFFLHPVCLWSTYICRRVCCCMHTRPCIRGMCSSCVATTRVPSVRVTMASRRRCVRSTTWHSTSPSSSPSRCSLSAPPSARRSSLSYVSLSQHTDISTLHYYITLLCCVSLVYLLPLLNLFIFIFCYVIIHHNI